MTQTKPKKYLGQNFLKDESVLKQIVGAADLSSKDIILEIGPGKGILTKELAQKAKKVIAIEKDKTLIPELKQNLKEFSNLEIIEGDILKLFPSFKFPARLATRSVAGRQDSSFKIVANIPYYLTSHLIRMILEAKNQPKEIVFLVQKEVAQRICSQPPKMTLLAVSVQFFSEPEIVAYVSKESFWPQPKVDSAILRITPYSSVIVRSEATKQSRGELGGIARLQRYALHCGQATLPAVTRNDKNFREKFFRILKIGFLSPRKKLLNNLTNVFEKEKIETIFKDLNFDKNIRAQNLFVGDWIQLTDRL